MCSYRFLECQELVISLERDRVEIVARNADFNHVCLREELMLRAGEVKGDVRRVKGEENLLSDHS